MKIPYPTISSNLAEKSHMYICCDNEVNFYGFVKCQTLKPYMIGSGIMVHFVDEIPNPERNPFRKPTRIDCDKMFITRSVTYPDDMLTDTRPDICEELFCEILHELNADGYVEVEIRDSDLSTMNRLIATIV